MEGGEEGGAGQGQQAGQQLQAEGDHAPHSGGQEPVGAQNKVCVRHVTGMVRIT